MIPSKGSVFITASFLPVDDPEIQAATAHSLCGTAAGCINAMHAFVRSSETYDLVFEVSSHEYLKTEEFLRTLFDDILTRCGEPTAYVLVRGLEGEGGFPYDLGPDQADAASKLKIFDGTYPQATQILWDNFHKVAIHSSSGGPERCAGQVGKDACTDAQNFLVAALINFSKMTKEILLVPESKTAFGPEALGYYGADVFNEYKFLILSQESFRHPASFRGSYRQDGGQIPDKGLPAWFTKDGVFVPLTDVLDSIPVSKSCRACGQS